VATPNLDQLKALVRGLAADGPELETRIEQARSVDYWRNLVPDTPLLDGRKFLWDPSEQASLRTMEEAIKRYRTGGYLSLKGVLDPEQCQRMRRCVETLRQNDWAPVFSFLYDGFWTIGRCGVLARLLRTLLGAPFALLPRVWTHFVYPASGNAGWQPHIDGSETSQHTVSVWIPLSEATLGNGCMHVVKRDELTAEVSRNYRTMETFSKRDVYALLRNSRALPAMPGQVLCWDDKIIHWGGSYEHGTEPRISIALEFTTRDFKTTKADPLIIEPLGALPDFETRLSAISRAILLYRKFELFAERFAPVAERLLAPTEKV
jgi:hypothetical protein